MLLMAVDNFLKNRQVNRFYSQKNQIISQNKYHCMPYRRLPNTDKARLRALEKANKKLEAEGPKSVPYSEASITQLRSFLPKFQHAIISLEADRKNQVRKNKEYTDILRKARMYISHYIQVMNFAISRGELKPQIREFYQLTEFGNALPPLNSEKDILEWGKKVIEGDQKRILSGGSPIYNPSIALVKVNFEKFADAYHFQKTLQANTDRSANSVTTLRDEADELILQLWNEIENTFEHLSDNQKRERSQQYGVAYAFRKSEMARIAASALQPRFNF